MDRYWTGNGPRVFRGEGGENLTGLKGAEDEVAEASAERGDDSVFGFYFEGHSD